MRTRTPLPTATATTLPRIRKGTSGTSEATSVTSLRRRCTRRERRTKGGIYACTRCKLQSRRRRRSDSRSDPQRRRERQSAARSGGREGNDDARRPLDREVAGNHALRQRGRDEEGRRGVERHVALRRWNAVRSRVL